MDLKTKIKNSEKIEPVIKNFFLAIFDKLSGKQKMKLEEALEMAEKSALSATNNLTEKILSDIRKDRSSNEKRSSAKKAENLLNDFQN